MPAVGVVENNDGVVGFDFGQTVRRARGVGQGDGGHGFADQ